MPTYYVDNTYSTNKGRDLRFANKPQIVPRRTDKIPKKSRVTEELLYTDQPIFNDSKTRPKNQAMALIDYKNAYDMVPQSWIINCLKIYKISDEVINIIEKIMTIWRVEMTAGGKSLAETKIKIGIILGDAVSPLLFVIAMIPLSHVLRKFAAGYKLSKTREKINHLMYMDDIKLFVNNEKKIGWLVGWLVIFYGISTFGGYLMPNPFLCK